MGVAENIDALLVKFDITAESLERIEGVQPPTVSRWRHGAMPREEPINRMVEYFGLERDDIVSDAFGLAAKEHGRVGIPTIKPAYSYHVVPMLGNAAAGEWREVYEQHGEAVTIPDEFAESHPRAFGVKPAGSSMDLVFRDDEIAICDPDMEVRDGSVALVGVNGDEATIKRVFFAGNTIVLHAESTMADEYPDIAINTKDPASPPVHLIGEIFWKTLPARPIKF